MPAADPVPAYEPRPVGFRPAALGDRVRSADLPVDLPKAVSLSPSQVPPAAPFDAPSPDRVERTIPASTAVPIFGPQNEVKTEIVVPTASYPWWPGWAKWPLIAAAAGAVVLLAIVAITPRPTTPPTGGPARPTSSPSSGLTSPPPSQFVAIPNVYNVSEGDGTKAITDSGLRYVIWNVCSSSVAANYIRQVVLIDSNNNVTDVLVDKDGVTAKGSQLARGTKVAVKVSNGVPCS